ncbi:hypothetical protein KY290_008502 [Solanum tuberosum]|uniref:Uncharacterized protein n=1 Tax=Solanum tuberosum TaxID=4113 RepID=A0ABQ7W9X5_SOLTU|nr:hypothetical protein KY285_032522 [Solanum tuberosum]KAH0712952.1 hypothetical protein KY289_008911 [Solanum tuberosum]KAH0777091.1 hypothetical protein KY290_008502 [Solanum tuberosum]
MLLFQPFEAAANLLRFLIGFSNPNFNFLALLGLLLLLPSWDFNPITWLSIHDSDEVESKRRICKKGESE